MALNGLTDVWPRWDEDPQGQIVVPGSTKDDVKSSSSAPAALPTNETPTPLTLPAGVNLPITETNAARGYVLRLPANVIFSGAPDDREGTLGNGTNAVRLRLRYLPGGAKSPQDYLPFAATIDTIEKKNITLPNGTAGTLLDYDLAAAAHPGMTNLRHRYLLIPTGQDKSDLLLAGRYRHTRSSQNQRQNAKRHFRRPHFVIRI